MKESDIQKKFWKNVVVTMGCWIWSGSKTSTGYGDFRFGKNGRFKAHRYSYFLFYGRHPSEWVLHSCDNPLCVNPKHLREGNPKENAHDMVSRNRHANQKKLNCPRGHALSKDNVYFHKNGSRRCKTCSSIYHRNKKAEKFLNG